MSVIANIIADFKLYRRAPHPKPIRQRITPAPPVIDRVQADSITSEVCEKHEVAPDDVLRKFNNRTVVKARHEVCYRLRKAGWKLHEITAYTGRSLNSVVYAIEQHERRMDAEMGN